MDWRIGSTKNDDDYRRRRASIGAIRRIIHPGRPEPGSRCIASLLAGAPRQGAEQEGRGV
jgi:hypothetical protein